MNKKSKILVTGSSGLLGSAVVRELKRNNYNNILQLNSKNCNLLFLNEIRNYFKKFKPNYVIHCANKVYGIGGNQKFKFKMQIENQIMNSNILNCCYENNVKKIVCIGSAAAYSPIFKNNIKEKNLLIGTPHISEYDYATSKRVLYQMLQSYSSNKLNYNYIIMNNLYGLNDNFNIENGHVVPSLIHKCFLAKFENKKFKVWGNPESKRCFLLADDAAHIIVKSIKFRNNLTFNLSSKHEITINELQKKIKSILNYSGKTYWTNPNIAAVKRRRLSMDVFNEYFKYKETNIDLGLKLTIDWLINNYKNIKK